MTTAFQRGAFQFGAFQIDSDEEDFFRPFTFERRSIYKSRMPIFSRIR